MSRRQLPRGTAAQLNAATFLPGEIAVDTTNDELRYDGDGSTVGGIALARKDGTNLTAGPASVTATGGSTANTLAARFGWELHLQDFGVAVPDNSTDATTTANAANTAGGRIFVPITSAGSVYATSHDDPTQDLLNAVWLGPGRIEINGYAQAPFRSIISSEQTAPASDDRYRFFNEGFAKANRASFMGVYGSSVTPSAASYTNFPQLAYDVLVYDNTAGFNASTSSHTSGRSGIFSSFNRLYHGGQGDLVARHVYMEGYSARASATHWLANPALVVDNGNLGISASGGAGTYMNHSEFTYSDNGHRAAVIDRVRNYDRDSNTTTLGEVWLHDRPQSVGTYDGDCVYSVAGKWKRGLDFTPTTLDSDKAAIILKASDRIYFGGVSAADSSGAQWFCTTLGSAYLYGTDADIRSSVAGTNSASLVTVGGTQTLTNKTLTSPTITTPTLTVLDNALTIQDNSDPTKQAQFQASGITAGQTRTLTIPDASTTIVGTDASQVLSNKTNINGLQVLWRITAADMNSTSDQAFTKMGTFTNWYPVQIVTSDSTGALATAAGGIYTATAKGGIAVVAAAQTYSGITGANQGNAVTVAAAGRSTLSASALYLSLTTGEGAARTLTFYVIGIPLT